MGGKDLRAAFGDGYMAALDQVRGGRFRSADLVTVWWDRAAEILTRPGSILRRFGFITTNSVTQTFSRRVIAHHLNRRPAVRLVFAIPDHPWVVGVGRADVRIAMSVAERGEADGQGRWLGVTDEADLATAFNEQVLLGRVNAGELKPGCIVLLENMWAEHDDAKIAGQYAETRDRLVAEGGSAGGLLMGVAVTTSRPNPSRMVSRMPATICTTTSGAK